MANNTHKRGRWSTTHGPVLRSPCLGLRCIYRIASHAPDPGSTHPTAPPLPLVPEVLTHIGLKRLLCRGAREGVRVSVTQHEAGNLERLGKRGGRDGGWRALESKREFGVPTHHAA